VRLQQRAGVVRNFVDRIQSSTKINSRNESLARLTSF
jgi:hypothetical protein